MPHNSNEVTQITNEPKKDFRELCGPERMPTASQGIPENLISARGELLLHGLEGGGVWLSGSPLLKAHAAVRANIKAFLSDWKRWRAEETSDREGFSFNSLVYMGDPTLLKQLVLPYVEGESYARTLQGVQVVLRINNFPVGEEDQAYHNHRAPFASYIFNPSMPPGCPIYELTWGHASDGTHAQRNVLTTGTTHSIEEYDKVFHRVKALDTIYTLLVGVIPSNARERQSQYFMMKDLGKAARLFNEALQHFDPEHEIQRMPDIDEYRSMKS
jgi:hypothetical protein